MTEPFAIGPAKPFKVPSHVLRVMAPSGEYRMFDDLLRTKSFAMILAEFDAGVEVHPRENMWNSGWLGDPVYRRNVPGEKDIGT